jgi:cytochrome c biogenesis protein CcmG/thiol:disulfide interchange protein DsbE
MPADPPDGEPNPPEQARPARRGLAVVVATLVIGGLVTLLVIGLTANKVDRSIDNAIAKGEPKPAPDFTLPVLAKGSTIGKRDGESLSLSELRGRAVVLNFWASWCDPCKREAPILEAAWQRARDRGGVVLGVDVQDLSENALAFIHRWGQTYPQVRDKGGGTYEAYGLTGVPETFFLDRAGRVRIHWVGEINAEQIADGLDLILDEAGR